LIHDQESIINCELHLDLLHNEGLNNIAFPTKFSFCGAPTISLKSPEMNPVDFKVLLSAKHLYGAHAPPHL